MRLKPFRAKEGVALLFRRAGRWSIPLRRIGPALGKPERPAGDYAL